MVFNSFEFVIFFAIVLVLYWGVLRRSMRGQNLLLLIASYTFYGWWDWRFLALLFVSSMIDYLAAIGMESTESKGVRRTLIIISILANLGILGFFKYYNFFAASFVQAMDSLGLHPDLFVLQVVLPVGISFYTFQSLNYGIDVYAKKIGAVRDPIVFLAFVSYFPHLVAGPIQRAIDLLPQFLVPRTITWPQIQSGCRQALWGLFKKMVVADTVAEHVNYVFGHCGQLDGISLVIGAFLFSMQIYCDFSGYTDVAIGTSRLMGFELKPNFALPYFSRNIAEFWRRWHIALSLWFRDYVYIPLGGSRAGKLRTMLNIVITFTLCGLWHGANWTFVMWGFLNGAMFIPLILLNRHQSESKDIVAANRAWPTWGEAGGMLLTQCFVLVSWVFFRAESMTQAWTYLGRTFTHPSLGLDYSRYTESLCLCGILLAIEWIQRRKAFGLELEGRPLLLRYAAYAALIVGMVELGSRTAVPFIYFQF